MTEQIAKAMKLVQALAADHEDFKGEHRRNVCRACLARDELDITASKALLLALLHHVDMLEVASQKRQDQRTRYLANRAVRTKPQGSIR